MVAAPPDGCTVLAGTVNTVVLVPFLNPSAGFATSALRPLAKVGSTGLVLIAGLQFEANSLQELQATARSRAQPLSAGHPGNETVQALAVAMIEQTTGMSFVQVPYGGSAPLVNDVIAGHVDLAVVAMPVGQPLVKQGRVKVLASLIPEKGMPAESWSGWFVTARTPAATTTSLRSALLATLRDEKVARALSELGAAPPVAAEQARFASRLQDAQTTYRDLARRRTPPAR